MRVAVVQKNQTTAWSRETFPSRLSRLRGRRARRCGGAGGFTTNKGYGVTGNPTDLTADPATEPYVVVAGLSGGPTAGADWDSLTPAAHGSQLQNYLRGAYWVFNDAEGVEVAEAMGDWGAHTEVSLCALEVS